MITQSNRKSQRNRKSLSPAGRTGGTEAVATVSIVATKVRLTLGVGVSLTGTPAVTVQGVPATSAAQVSPTIVDLTFAATPVTGNNYVIPSRDPALRTQNGGYVAAKAGTF
jgi:hypothetical protein